MTRSIRVAMDGSEDGLVAMGAQGHSIREALLGGVTEAMLQMIDRPLLMTR